MNNEKKGGTENMEKTRNTNNKSKNKNMAKSQKGITLVALVITIVLNCSCLATERNKRIAKI